MKVGKIYKQYIQLYIPDEINISSNNDAKFYTLLGAFTLYGITSWGQHCGKANKPGVYVRVAHYRRWIDQKIKDSLAGR